MRLAEQDVWSRSPFLLRLQETPAVKTLDDLGLEIVSSNVAGRWGWRAVLLMPRKASCEACLTMAYCMKADDERKFARQVVMLSKLWTCFPQDGPYRVSNQKGEYEESSGKASVDFLLSLSLLSGEIQSRL